MNLLNKIVDQYHLITYTACSAAKFFFFGKTIVYFKHGLKKPHHFLNLFSLQWLSWPLIVWLVGAMLFGELPASQEVLRPKVWCPWGMETF